MRWTQTLIPTLRQVPAEAVVPSHQMMLRAGLIQQVAAGSYTYLPLGWRVLHKVMNIIREEMDRAGAAEVLMPTLQPIELWEQTGRRVDYGDNLFVLKDRHGREQALGPTHEEVVTHLVKTYVESYRSLPLNLYQIQTKFRDEFRPRYGVLRSREFQMKDAYSFHIEMEGPAGLNAEYENMRDAYRRIFTRCGVDFVEVEAEAGPIGGDASHEFMVLTPTGEDTILSNGAGYAANVEKCETGERPVSETFAPIINTKARGKLSPGFTPAGEPTGKLEQVHTPGCASIEDVTAFFKKELKTKLKPQNMLKTLVCRAQKHWVVAVVRADHDLNEAKLRKAIGETVELADETEAKTAGFSIGYVGPHKVVGRDDVVLIVDPDAAQSGFWVTGANEADRHVKHFSWKRDVIDALGDDAAKRITVADIRNAVEGDPAPESKGGGDLKASKGIEVGHVFKLGSKYSNALGLTVTDEKQAEREVIMGCYGIGVNRIIASAIESDRGHDDRGIVWPMAIAPYHVVITPIKYEGDMHDVANKLYAELTTHGVEVLLDDRDERPGVKFNDADLIGIPVRITVGNKGLELDTPSVEYKLRHAAEAEMVPVDDVVDRVVELIKAP